MARMHVFPMLVVINLCIGYNAACVVCTTDIPTTPDHQNTGVDISKTTAINREKETKSENNLHFNQIPINFYRELSNVTDYIEFFELFHGPEEDKKRSEEQEFERISENIKRSVERASALIPKPAICIPENTIVPLLPRNPSKDPFILYVPSCTRVKRCGGCCGPQLSCQPIETETLNFQIHEYVYGERTPRNRQVIPVEHHLKCICDCRVKAEDCNSYQIYDSKNCKCDCTNSDEKTKCNALEHKIWDDQECRCVCRDSHSCTTGTLFDENQCKCLDPFHTESIEPPAEISATDRRRFIVKAVPVDPDNSTLYIV